MYHSFIIHHHMHNNHLGYILTTAIPINIKGEVKSFFLFHHWVRIRQTKTSFNRQFSPKRPEVGQIFILRSNFDQNKDHMTSKQVRGPSKNWHPASEGTLKTDIQQVRGPSSNNRVFFLLKHPYVTLEPLLGKGYKITGCFFFFKLSNWPLNKISESNCRAATGVLINIAQKQKLQNIDQNICNIDHTAL